MPSSGKIKATLSKEMLQASPLQALTKVEAPFTLKQGLGKCTERFHKIRHRENCKGVNEVDMPGQNTNCADDTSWQSCFMQVKRCTGDPQRVGLGSPFWYLDIQSRYLQSETGLQIQFSI